MNLMARLALSQLKVNRTRSGWTLFGIALSAAMLTAVFGFAASAKEAMELVLGIDIDITRSLALLSLGSILGLIIISCAVIVISNAFRISAGERTRQFGILKSAGATSEQISQSVLYEGLLLSVIAIPIGIISGLLIELAGISIISFLIRSLVEDKVLRLGQQAAAEIRLHFSAPIPVLVAAIAASLGTVLISAWLPARKAARIPAIEAIRSTGEVSLSRRDVSVSRLTQALFGFEGTLAAKSLKRNRRNFRATVLSLSICIVLLVSASSIGNLMKKVTGLMLPTMDATATASMNFPIEYDNGGNIIYKTLDQQKIKQITELLREYPETAIINVNTFSALSPVSLPREAIGDRMLKLIGSLHPNDASYDIGFTLVTLDDKSYAKTCELANVPLGSNILANIVRITERGSTSESNALNFDQVKSKVISLTKDGTGETFSLSIDGELSGSNVPKEIRYATSYGTAIIVPSFDATFSTWIAKVEDSAGFTDYASEVLHNNAPDDSSELPLQILSQDIAAQMARMDATVDTVMLFTYGFVGMLALMAIASVISAISTNVRSRSKEFAVLESVGMTRDGVSRMLSLESALCSLRSLAFGIPLGLAASFALYHAMGLAAEVEYSFPWLAVSQCVLGVFFVTWATMRYAASRLKRESIVSAMLSSDGA